MRNRKHRKIRARKPFVKVVKMHFASDGTYTECGINYERSPVIFSPNEHHADACQSCLRIRKEKERV